MKQHVQIMTLHEDAGAEAEQLLAQPPVDLEELKKHYFLCEYVPLDEMPDSHPEIVAWCMRTSRTTAWRTRQMRPLQHMDLVDVGGTAYLIYDKAMARNKRIDHTTIPETINYVMVRINL